LKNSRRAPGTAGRALRHHHNAKEIHRELRQTPHQAWAFALRSRLRHGPVCAWWPYVWSVRTQIKVGDDGRVPDPPQNPS
jgi:hypothetical protein